MNIIHDALKKAQEHRKEKPAGIPYGNVPEAKKRPQFIVIAVVAIAAVIVIGHLLIPAFHPKKVTPIKRAESTKPAQPAAQPVQTAPPTAAQVQPVPQKVPETQQQLQKPAGPAVQTVMNTQGPSPDKGVPRTVNPVILPGPKFPVAAGQFEPARRKSKGIQPAADDEQARRFPARKIEDDSINRQYNEAVRLMNAGQLREAQKIFLVILGRKPDHVEALNNMGVIWASLGNKKDAVTYFKKVLEYRPNYSKAYNNIGLVMMSECDSQLAEEYFRKAISMEPESLEPYLNLSALLRSQKRYAEAARALDKPIDRNINDPNLYLSYAVVKDNVGHSEQAIRYYRQYLGLAKLSQARESVGERLRYLEERGKR
jgi:Tfp pilus assembly protein PilF